MKYLLFLFLNLNMFSQNSGLISYKILLPVPEAAKIKGGEVKNTFENASAKAEKLIFSLEFNPTESHFYCNNIMTDDSEMEKDITKMTLIMLGNINYYYDSKKNSGINVNALKGIAIKDENHTKDWKISSESKTIDNYLCYKAECIEKYTRDGKEMTVVVTAWFAPTLPYSFGPLGYNGLPGLILELNKFNRTAFVSNIKLTNEPIVIKFPNGKTVTSEEYMSKTGGR